ncbi:MAG: bifunctional riboflavin kinase/FAD synthetase [bacterium]
MRKYEDLESIREKEVGCVAAVGNFDGVHTGHRAIFRETVSRAEDIAADGLVLTFSRHPAATVMPDNKPSVIMTVADRLRIASGLGVNAALVLPFDRQTASMIPEQFVEEVLVNTLSVSAVVAGQGWRFGKDRAGDVDLLSALGRERGFCVYSVPSVFFKGLPVSSTRIRDTLSDGDVEGARNLLGRPHFVRGTVIEGQGRGRGLGYPTVNLDCGDVILPANGVYGAAFSFEGRSGPAAVNIGTRPTFGGGPLTVEAHLFEIDERLYDSEITLSFLARLRDEMTFEDEHSLREQISEDVKSAVKIFSQISSRGISF